VSSSVSAARRGNSARETEGAVVLAEVVNVGALEGKRGNHHRGGVTAVGCCGSGGPRGMYNRTRGMQRVGATETGGDGWGMITASTRGDVAKIRNMAWTHTDSERCQSGALGWPGSCEDYNKETCLVQSIERQRPRLYRTRIQRHLNHKPKNELAIGLARIRAPLMWYLHKEPHIRPYVAQCRIDASLSTYRSSMRLISSCRTSDIHIKCPLSHVFAAEQVKQPHKAWKTCAS